MDKQRKKLGLALGCGGIRGAAHIGVIKCLEDNGIKIDMVAGCSTGSLVGSLYCQKQNINTVIDYFNETKFYLSGQKYVFFLEYRRKLKNLESKLKGLKFDELKVPFKVVATNISNGQPHIFTKGDLFTAISSSVSVPIIMPQFQYRGDTLVDGGICMPVPVEIIKQPDNVVLAVNLYHNIFPMDNYDSLGKLNILIKSFYVSVYQLAKQNSSLADITIEPDFLTTNVNSPNVMKKMIDSGYETTKAKIDDIKKLLD